MKLQTFCIGILLQLAITSFAQNVTIQGILADSLQSPLMSATVVLLNPQDSTMEYFAITTSTGNFKIKNIKRGEYIFQASYIGYESIFNPIDLSDAKELLQMGTLVLKREQKLLGEVTVNAERIPILIKKDTVEYNAGSFKVKPNAPVEELLRRLPGVEVDKNGTIKAHGKEVNSIMVDGKEFFGNDPKIASQNLPADAIDKVQVYDKKSEMAEFTGVDDGVKDKTINLKLKDGKKKGYFGNVSAGYGSDDRFESKVNVNRFNKKSQLSLIGRMNNINENGFSFSDYLNFSGGLENMMENGGEDGQLTFGGNTGIPFDAGQPNYGFTNTGSGGANFNFDISKKTEFSGSYFFNRIKKREEAASLRQNFFEENTFPSEVTEDKTTKNNHHRINTKIRSKIDFNQILTLRTNFTLSDGLFQNIAKNNIFNTQQLLENTSRNNNDYDNRNWTVNTRLSYLLKFKKKGRSFAANLDGGAQDNERTNNLESINSFLINQPNLTFSDSIHQVQNQNQNQLAYSLNAAYTEPISRKSYLQFRYSRGNYTNDLTREVFDIQNEVKQRNDSLSNSYDRKYFYDRGGLTYKINGKKYIFSAGAQIQHSKLDGQIGGVETPIVKNFWAVLPAMNFYYDFANSHTLRLNYRTNVQEPSLEQLQPIVNNVNPLNLYLGNPDLRPEYNHQLGVQYMLFDQFNFRSLFASLNTRYTTDKITNARSIDALFIQTTQPINVKKDWATNGSISYDTPLKFMRSKMGIRLSGTYNQGILFLNSIENKSNRLNTSIDFTIENRKKDIVDILVGVNWSYNQSKYSVSKTFDQKFNTITYFSDWTLTLMKDWTIGTSFDYTIYQGADFANQQQVPMWNASISRPVFKHRGTIEVAARDLLNQGIGINRQNTLNYIEDTRVQSLGRYVMLTFSYSLNFLGDRSSGAIKVETKRRRI